MNQVNTHIFQVVLDSRLRMFAQTNQYLSRTLLKNSNIKITQLGCSGGLSSCISLSSLGDLSKNYSSIKKACSACRKNQSYIPSSNKYLLDESELTPDQSLTLGRIKTILIQEKHVASVLDIKFDGIKFCRITFFDWSIRLKLTDKSLLDHQSITEFIDALRDLFIIYNSVNRLNIESNITNYLIYINGNYSQNTLLREIFSRKKISSISVEPQPFSNKLLNKIALKTERVPLKNYGLAEVNLDEVDICVNSLKTILHTFRARFEGKEYNSYTTLVKTTEAKNEVDRLNNFCQQHGKIHTYFAHSSDEVVPHIVTHLFEGEKGEFFNNQDEIIQWLIENAENYPEIGFIIRLHPRMAVNKRDGFESSEHKRIKGIFNSKSIHKNVMIFNGDSKISSYYLIYKSNLVLVGWSTIGLESLALGKPTISLQPSFGMYPVQDISLQPHNAEELFGTIVGNLKYGEPTINRLGAWMSYAYERQFIQIPIFRQFSGYFGIIGYIFHKIVCSLGISRFESVVLSLFGRKNFKVSDNLTIDSHDEILVASDLQIRNLFVAHQEQWRALMIQYEK